MKPWLYHGILVSQKKKNNNFTFDCGRKQMHSETEAWVLCPSFLYMTTLAPLGIHGSEQRRSETRLKLVVVFYFLINGH